MPSNRGIPTNPNDKAKNFSESIKRLLKELNKYTKYSRIGKTNINKSITKKHNN